MDEFDSNTTPMNESHDEQQIEGSSRRTFLKASVVGSATAVAVSGVGAAAFTLTGHHTGLKKYLALNDSISGVTETACVTSSGFEDQTSFGEDSIFFFAKFNAVPAGTYTFDVSPTLPTSVVGYQSIGAGNFTQVVAYSGGVSFTCHPSDTPTASATVSYPAQQAHVPVTFTTTSDGDVVLWLHLKGIAAGSSTLTATLYQGTDDTGTNVGSASATITVS